MYAEQLLLWLDQDGRLGPLGTTGPVDIMMDPYCLGIGLLVVLMRGCIALMKAPAVEHCGTMVVISSE